MNGFTFLVQKQWRCKKEESFPERIATDYIIDIASEFPQTEPYYSILRNYADFNC